MLADYDDATRSVQLSGQAGDALVFDVDLVHAGSLNVIGARRRSLQITFFAERLYASRLKTAHLRSIRMPAAWFSPTHTQAASPADPRDDAASGCPEPQAGTGSGLRATYQSPNYLA